MSVLNTVREQPREAQKLNTMLRKTTQSIQRRSGTVIEINEVIISNAPLPRRNQRMRRAPEIQHPTILTYIYHSYPV